MIDKEKDLVARLLKQSILTLCKETVSYNHRLEIDGIVCITVENETQQIVIKVHEFLEKHKQDDWINQNNRYHGDYGYQQSEQSIRKWPGILKVNPWPENAQNQNQEYNNENSYDMNRGYVDEIENDPISLTSSDDTEVDELETFFQQAENAESVKQEDNGVLEEDNDLDLDNQVTIPSAPIQKPIVNRLIAKKLIDKSKLRSAKKYPPWSLSLDHRLQEKSSEPIFVENSSDKFRNIKFAKPLGDITCKRCEMVFSDENQFENHNLTSHNLFTCLVCYNTFTCRNNMKRHMRLHTGQKPYKCTICSESFTRKDDVKRHLMRHTYNKPYRCNVCGKGYMDRKTIKNHMRKEHQKKLVHVCPTCGESFDENLKYQEHKKNHPELKMYRCTKCDFTGSNPLMFHKHMLIHGPSRSYTCRACNFIFNDPFRYSCHLKKHKFESDFTSYQCCFCDHSLPSYDQFVKHEHTHVQGKRYTCSLCYKHFRYPSNLRDHMLTHEIEKRQQNFLMDTENVSYGEKQIFANLPTHIDLMNNDSENGNNISCDYHQIQTSDYSQTQKGDQNGGESSNEYWCTECHQGFASEIELTEHISVSHESSVSEVRKSAERDQNPKYNINYPQHTANVNMESPERENISNNLQSHQEMTTNHRHLSGGRLCELQEKNRKFDLVDGGAADVDITSHINDRSVQNVENYSSMDDKSQIPIHVQQGAFNGGTVSVKQEPISNDSQFEFSSSSFNSRSNTVLTPASISPTFHTSTDFVDNSPVFPSNGDLSRNLGSPGRLASPNIDTSSTVKYSPGEKIKLKIRTPGFERVVTPDILFRTKDKFTCEVCYKEFSDFESFDQHGMSLHRRFICEYCGRMFTSKPNRERHVRYHTGEKPYRCELCDQSFYRGDDLKYHRTTRHSEVKPFSCNKCRLAFAWPKELEKHIKTHRH